MVAAVMAAALQRLRHLVEADAAVGIAIELGEHVVGLRQIGAAGASAFSNSDLLIWPSPLASSCENRSFNASSRLVDVEDVALDDVELVELDVALVLSDDWLCAAISALIVSGEICAQLPELTDEVAPLLVLLLLVSIANGSVAPCDDPVFWVDDEDFEFVSD